MIHCYHVSYDEWAGHGVWQAVASLSAGVGSLSLARTVKTAWSMPVRHNVQILGTSTWIN